jgi:hypothetical protein
MSKVLKFKCPACDSNELEEVMTNVTQYSSISIIEEGENGVVAIDYANNNCEDGEVDHYQCMGCGYILTGVHDEIDLAEWLKKNCKQK